MAARGDCSFGGILVGTAGGFPFGDFEILDCSFREMTNGGGLPIGDSGSGGDCPFGEMIVVSTVGGGCPFGEGGRVGEIPRLARPQPGPKSGWAPNRI